MAAAFRESQRTEKAVQPTAAAADGGGQAKEELIFSVVPAWCAIAHGHRDDLGERRTQDGHVAASRQWTAAFRIASASMRGRFLAAALWGRFERGLDMPALRRPLLLQPRVIAR